MRKRYYYFTVFTHVFIGLTILGSDDVEVSEDDHLRHNIADLLMHGATVAHMDNTHTVLQIEAGTFPPHYAKTYAGALHLQKQETR